MRVMSRFGFLALFIVFQGCMLAPRYERPYIEMPETWRIEADEASTYANVRWWKELNDPVLDSLIDEALANNRDLKVAIERVNEFQGQLEIVRSNLYPQLGGALSAMKQESSLYLFPPFPGNPRVYDIFTSILNASYDVDIWGEIRCASGAALAQLLGSIEARRTVVLTLVAAVASSYIQLRQYDMQREISQATYGLYKEAFDIALARYRGGLTSELDVKQTEAEVETAAAQVLQYELSMAKEENLLSVLIGRAPTTIERGLSIEQLSMPAAIPAGIPCEILAQRPDIMEAEDIFIASNYGIGVARAQFLPSITLTGNYGNASLQLSQLLTSPATTWEYGVNILQPLYTGGRLTGQLEVAKAQRSEAYYHYQQVVLNALREVEDALIAHKLSLELVRIQYQREEALKSALYLAQLQYYNGQVDFLNVLDARRNLFNAQLVLAQGQSYTFLSLVAVYKALGGGWVIDADAQSINQSY